jgi:hypothetical protein
MIEWSIIFGAPTYIYELPSVMRTALCLVLAWVLLLAVGFSFNVFLCLIAFVIFALLVPLFCNYEK